MAVLSRLAGVLVALTAVGCDAEILSGVYLCGPELSCPDHQVCSAATAICVDPDEALPFACPPATDVDEPDDELATARQISLGCPVAGVTRIGCLPAASDVDWITILAPPGCVDHPLEVDVRYPTAFAPIVVERVLGDGTTAEVAPPCDITGGLGANDGVCVRTPVPSDGLTRLRFSLDPELDCDGACDFTHYEVTVEVL